MISSALSRRRGIVAVAVFLMALLAWTGRLNLSPWSLASGLGQTHRGQRASDSSDLPHVATYFDQVFSVGTPAPYGYPGLKEACGSTDWSHAEGGVYLKCGGMSAGMTSMVSQVKVCLKMAIDAGTNLVLPSMPLRDPQNLLDFNIENPDAYMPYGEWFDADHLRAQMGRACPRMRIVRPDELGAAALPLRHEWEIPCSNAFGYKKYYSYFWVGRPYGKFFAEQYRKLQEQFGSADNSDNNNKGKGATVVSVDSEFLLFRIANDPTRRELRLWNDLSHVVRFREQPRQIAHRLLARLPRPFYGVHFRVENDTIWSQDDNQMQRHLEALDRAWERWGSGSSSQKRSKPQVYLACGDQAQLEKFVAAGAARGWDVTHKWRLAAGDSETTAMIDALAFDFQGAVDMAVMVRSRFFMGIQGSAFSWTIANIRDPTGRYRGSSLDVPDDEGAGTHLFSEIDADEYACCL